MAISDNLVSYWSLDEASGNAIDAHGSNDLTETGGSIASVTGLVAGARDFETTDARYFTVASNSTLQVSGSRTWVLWVKLESLGSPAFIAKWNAASFEYLIDIASNRYRLALRDAANAASKVVSASTFGVPPTGVWTMVACWYDSSGDAAYIQINDGVIDSLGTIGGVRASTTAFALGARSTPANYLDGTLDEVGLWDRVLTTAELTWLYNSGAGRSYADIVAGGQAKSLLWWQQTYGQAGR